MGPFSYSLATLALTGACFGSFSFHRGATSCTKPTHPQPETHAFRQAGDGGASRQIPASAWRFGVMADTQWHKSMSKTGNPGTVSVGIIEQVNRQFIEQGVKFVIQVGDLKDSTKAENLQIRADAAKGLMDVGIGFYPLRGNHDSQKETARVFVEVFPQTQGGDHQGSKQSVKAKSMGISGFTSPSFKRGLTYAFDCQTPESSARFVLLDQFKGMDFFRKGDMAQQLDWLTEALCAKAPHACHHTFVFSHKGLILPCHQDTLFGDYPGEDLASENRFMNTLRQHGTHYSFCGHDHIHQRALIDSDQFKGENALQQITCAACSYKFYTPNATPHDKTGREHVLSRDLYRVGYYIVTVAGPSVTVDYYASDPQVSAETDSYPKGSETPTLQFTKRESFGYSLDNKMETPR